MNSPFDGDHFNQVAIEEIVRSYNIDCIVETGVYMGDTTRVFATLVPAVIAIESSDKNWSLSDHLNSVGNVIRIKGDSAWVLKNILPLKHNVLFYLDAHWEAHSPLLDELDAIMDSRMKPVIAVHDFFNPDHPDFNYEGNRPENSYDIGVYKWDLIESRVIGIYGDNEFKYWYNSLAEGNRSGVVYIAPKLDECARR